MKNKILLMFLITGVAPACDGAGLIEVRNAGEVSFFRSLSQIILPVKPQDAFAGIEACAIVDAVTIRRYSLAEAARALSPCMQGLSKRYEVSLHVAPDAVRGLVIDTGGVSAGAPRLADLRQGLSLRNNRLLGHAVKLERARRVQQSVLQEIVDGCFMAAVVRDMASNADFIRYYSRCILSDKALGVEELKPSVEDSMGVEVFTSRALADTESFNGAVSVDAGRGPVTFLVTAYSAK